MLRYMVLLLAVVMVPLAMAQDPARAQVVRAFADFLLEVEDEDACRRLYRSALASYDDPELLDTRTELLDHLALASLHVLPKEAFRADGFVERVVDPLERVVFLPFRNRRHEVAFAERVDRAFFLVEPLLEHGYIVRHRLGLIERLRGNEQVLDIVRIVLLNFARAVKDQYATLCMRKEPNRREPSLDLFKTGIASVALSHEASGLHGWQSTSETRLLTMHVLDQERLISDKRLGLLLVQRRGVP